MKETIFSPILTKLDGTKDRLIYGVILQVALSAQVLIKG